jgi:hypothetical protein
MRLGSREAWNNCSVTVSVAHTINMLLESTEMLRFLGKR